MPASAGRKLMQQANATTETQEADTDLPVETRKASPGERQAFIFISAELMEQACL